MLIIDAQLSPSLAVFMNETFGLEAFSLNWKHEYTQSLKNILVDKWTLITELLNDSDLVELTE